MEDKKYLYDEIEGKAFRLRIQYPEIPKYITENLKHSLWNWQKKAIENFLIHEEIKMREGLSDPIHLMFNMATGTGKTLIMAAMILYYYKKGYRHFIFFVNQNNIVDKTENNFIEKHHTKYLFRQNIIVHDKTVNIRKVDLFDDTNDIQIKFTSIHKLHNAVYVAKENSVTLEDLQKRDLVMIGDEAHHLNASTIRGGQVELDLPVELKDNASEKDVEKSWENTVLKKILCKQNQQKDENRNVLLEFTATIPKNESVVEKYRNKTIYKFELVDFLKAGYTKEINLVSTSLKKKEKILLTLLFNWYRHKISIKYGIPNFKPVILFKSKFIDDSRSDYEEFLSMVKDLTAKDLNFIKSIEGRIKEGEDNKVYEQGKSRVMQMLKFMKDENIKSSEIAEYIKYNFGERNCIITNSKDNKATTKEKTTEDQERLLNSLEDTSNHIRAIFTVNRLTEGWDVLNLFDIVRLYEGRDEGYDKKTRKRKAGAATVQEIQLIGRGVRYYPFSYNNNEANRRKFDNDLDNPIRVVEEFYYHSDDNHRYLDELKRELKNKGLVQDNRAVKRYELKMEFKESDFYKEVKVWKNKRINNPNRRKKLLSELAKEPPFEYKTKDFALKEEQIQLESDSDDVLVESKAQHGKTLSKKLKDFERHIVLKAINKKATKDLSLFRYNNLIKELEVNSIDNLLKDPFIGQFRINVVTTKGKKGLEDISNEEQLNLLLEFFDQFSRKIKEISNPYKGTDKFKPFTFEELFGEVKEKNVLIDEESKSLEAELLKHKWYVLNGFNGTSEEKKLIEFIRNKIGNLEEKYDEVYLFRNEEVYKIYDFKEGRGFEPDFLLFLKGEKQSLYYQIFIEPKGSQFVDKEGDFKESKEGWKDDFLENITIKYMDDEMLKVESKEYKLIGLPLYNHEKEREFSEAFDNLIQDSPKETKKSDLFFSDVIPDKIKYIDYLPVYTLAAACGKFGEGREAEILSWVDVEVLGLKAKDERLFVSQVKGGSMEPRISNNDYCVFRANVVGSRNDKIVLVQHHTIHDPDNGGRYTVKKYKSYKSKKPDKLNDIVELISLNKKHDTIVLEDELDEEFKVIAEFVQVLK